MADSTIRSILEGMRTKVRALTLAGVIDSDNVEIYKVPKEADLAKRTPGVLICPFGSETIAYPLAGKIDITVPFLWAYYDYDKINQTLNEDRNYNNRETIMNAFEDDHRLTGVASVVNRVMRPLAVVDVAIWRRRGIFFSGCVIDYTYRRTRGA